VFYLKINDFLENVCEQIKYKPIRKEISKELESHLKEVKEELLKKGVDEVNAEEEAVQQMGNAQDIGKKLNKIHKPNLDWKLLIILGILLVFGALVAYTKTSDITRYVCYAFVGGMLGIGIYFVDYRKILKFSMLWYIIATIIVGITIIFGTSISGVRYLGIGSMYISATSIALPLYVISFVGFLYNKEKKNNWSEKFLFIFNENIKERIDIKRLKIITLSIISLAIFIPIPSVTSAVILGIVYLIIATLYIVKSKENVSRKLGILWGGPLIMLIIITTFYLAGGASSRLDRITTLFDPDTNGKGWLIVNRRDIINSSVMYGKAEDMSDAIQIFDEGTEFAFISILAHYGWIVASAIIITVLLFSVKIIHDAIKVQDFSGKLLIVGIASMFIIQSIFNILMNLNLWIESGYSLPFISYGGTNLIINISCLAIILSVYRRKDILIKEDYNY